MKAVARLVWSYFTCTMALRWFSGAGVASIAVAGWVLSSFPQSGFILTLTLAGTAALFIGSSMMPLMLGRMARSRGLHLFPAGRVKLLVSAFITVIFTALPVALLEYVAFVTAAAPAKPDPARYARFHHDSIQNLWMIYTSLILLYGWLYVAMWFITSERNTRGYLKGLAIVALVIFAPSKEITTLESSVRLNLVECAVTWLVFGAGFLLWPRLRAFALRVAGRFTVFGSRPGEAKITGREVDLLLGTGNPWFLALGQFLPVVLAARIGFYSATVWLFYLTIFSTVAGAIAGQAAERSRALWLRGEWSRDQLFLQVERSFWRHNNYVLGILLVLMVGIGSYANLPPTLLAVGLPLLILGTTVSTYLGLMLTQRLRWPEAILAIGVTLTLMAVAVLAARSSGNFTALIALEFGLVVTALVLRRVARNRWSRLDWMLCRPDRALLGRSSV